MEEKLEQYEFSGPTKENVIKMMHIQCENTLNIPHDELDGRTFFEDTVINGKPEGFIRITRGIEKKPLYNDYLKTGGVLNVLNPRVNEEMDLNLKEIQNIYCDKVLAIDKWKNKNSELWSNLPPKLVWAGGGELETLLLRNFCENISEKFGNEEYDFTGQAIIKAVSYLREWQYTKNHVCNFQTPVDAITEERQEIYDRKIKFIIDRGIQCDFI
jgi:hypothetical protein